MMGKLVKRVIACGLCVAMTVTMSAALYVPAVANESEKCNEDTEDSSVQFVSGNDICKTDHSEEEPNGEIKCSEEIDIQTAGSSLNYLTFDNSEGYLSVDVEANIRKVVEQTYKPICDFFNEGTLLPVTIIAEQRDDFCAYTVGTTVTISTAYFNNNPEDYDALTHELVHVAQAYGNHDIDTWLVEGIADYGRNKFGINNETAGWEIGMIDDNACYLDGYRAAAGLLIWIEHKYDSNFVSKINAKAKKNEYDIALFETYTGYDVDQLWLQYLASLGKAEPSFDLNLKPVKTIPNGTDIGSYLTIQDESNALQKTIKDHIRKMFETQYVNICKEYNYGELTAVTLKVEPSYDGVAYTEGNVIVVSPAYLNKNPEDYDCITHELIHVAQNYDYAAVPDWLVEGIADYGRYQFGMNNSAAGWELGYYEMGKDDYIKGYRETASFLRFVVENYNADTVKLLNQLCKEKTYNTFAWKAITGKTLRQLQAEYVKAKPKHTKLGNEIENIKFEDKNGKTVQLYDFSKKATLLYYGNWDENIYNPLSEAQEIKSVYGDDISIIFVFYNQNFETLEKYLKNADKSFLKNVTFLHDPAGAACWNLFSYNNEEGNTVLSWPATVLLDDNNCVVYETNLGNKYGIKNTPEKELLIKTIKKFLPYMDISVNGKVNPGSVSVPYEKNKIMKVKITPSSVKSLKYKSNNTKIASIDKKGNIKLKGTGVVKISITGSADGKKLLKTLTLYVYPKKVSLSSVKSSKKGQLRLSWKKVERANGYEIQYATNRKMKNAISVKVNSLKKTECILKKLKSKKIYYVRVRAYKKTGKQFAYGKFSKVKKVRIK